ncbi:FG-GAP repeat domain-containing protein [Tahibacter harae]|uniref:VCBS repeat-containing protein n=1 Tax=Tahibacter harae TaxID=2963937 RepID=A0ABT1QQ91_9GAMM|nr:VCBS repeat-containing protein [Tahibacter harae]MCQ4164465.1 VCBS repeat-containing protein [Tahibacter harae]
MKKAAISIAAVAAVLLQSAAAAPVFSAQSYPLAPREHPARLLGGADLTSDGLADLVVLTDSGGVFVFARTAGGTFSGGSSVAHDAVFPYTMALADFNGDGRTDLVYAVATGLRVLLQGSGGFEPGVRIDLGTAAVPRLVEALLAGDFNNDGKPDIAAADNDEANSGTPANSVFFAAGLGGGAFDTARPRLPAPLWPRRLLGLDANGDGRGDILIGAASGAPAITRYDTASAVFVQHAFPSIGLESLAEAAPGDIDGDGKLDLALLIDGRNGSYLRLDRGNGSYAFTTQTTRLPPSAVSGLRLGDFDNDGKADLLLALQGGNAAAAILRGRGDFTFDAPQNLGAGFDAAGLARGDYNSDGRLDFALIDAAAGRLVVFLQQ